MGTTHKAQEEKDLGVLFQNDLFSEEHRWARIGERNS